MKVLRSRLLDIEQQKQADAIRDERRGMVGGGERSEKIRTYNFPQNRLTDHRIGLTLYKLDRVMEGDLSEMLDAVVAHHQAALLQAQNAARGQRRETRGGSGRAARGPDPGASHVLAESFLLRCSNTPKRPRFVGARRACAASCGSWPARPSPRPRSWASACWPTGRCMLRYRVEDLGYTRTAALSSLEAATLRYALHRSGKASLSHEERAAVEEALGRLNESLGVVSSCSAIGFRPPPG